MEILPPQPSEVEEPLRHVVERALANGAPAASRMVLDTPDERWLRDAVSLGPDERARAVFGAARDASLLRAQRLGFGGAVRLPASTGAMEQALTAAAEKSRARVVCSEISFLEIADDCRPELWAVTCANRRFWSWQLGIPALSEGFAALAESLGVPRLLIPWPALLVIGGSAEDIHVAWRDVTAAQPGLPTQGLLVEQVRSAREGAGGGIMPRLTDALSRAEVSGSTGPLPESCAPRPICALPTGEMVARWSPVQAAAVEGAGALMTPEYSTAEGFKWWLQSSDGEPVEVRETQLPGDLAGDREKVVRLPGWLTESLRRGTPAALIVERFADASRRSGVTLWVSNVDAPGLNFLLRLGAPLWVDGPAVPG